MTNHDEPDAFDDIFTSKANVADEVTPEPVTQVPREEKKSHVKTWVKYGLWALVGLFLLLAIIVVIAVITTPGNTTSEQGSTVVMGSSGNMPDQQQEQEQRTNTEVYDLHKSTDDTVLEQALKQAKANTEIRDKKYKELLLANQLLFQENENLKKKLDMTEPGKSIIPQAKTAKPLNVLSGASLNSTYNGYAFIRVGNTVYSVTIGEKINGATVTEIDVANRRVYTTKGIIK